MLLAFIYLQFSELTASDCLLVLAALYAISASSTTSRLRDPRAMPQGVKMLQP
jgi:hypothetical protein